MEPEEDINPNGGGAMMLRLGMGLLVGFTIAVPFTLRASAGSETLKVSTRTVHIGDTREVDIRALAIGSPGLGAWTIDLSWNDSIVEAIKCSAMSPGVCNTAFASDTARVTGGTKTGLRGDMILVTYAFRCLREGTSPLTLETEVFADAAPSDPQSIRADVINGAITCVDTPLSSSGTIRIGSAAMDAGQRDHVTLGAIASPGLGAWKIDVKYDPTIVTLIDCAGNEGTVCTTDFEPDTVRLRGVSALGLSGDFWLATLTFRCDTEGATLLSVQPSLWADATIADPDFPPNPELKDGSITCGAVAPIATPTIALPQTGNAGTNSSATWPIAAAALLGALALITGAALARKSP